MEELDTTSENKPARDAKGRLLPGNTANPHGRPKGSLSIKDAVRKHLEDNPDDFVEFVEHFAKNNKELAWQMLEGRPPQKSEVDMKSDGKPISTITMIDPLIQIGVKDGEKSQLAAPDKTVPGAETPS